MGSLRFHSVGKETATCISVVSQNQAERLETHRFGRKMLGISRRGGTVIRVVLTASMIAGAIIVALLVRRSIFGSAHGSDVVPSGTVLVVRLTEPLSSRTTRLGDKFHGRLDTVKGTVAVHPGVQIEGLCVAAQKAIQGLRGGYLRLALSALQDRDGHRLPVQTATVSVWGNGTEQGEPSPSVSMVTAWSDRPLPTAVDGKMQEAVVGPPTQLSFMLIE